MKSRLLLYDEEDDVIVEMWIRGVRDDDDDDDVFRLVFELVLRLPIVALLVDAGTTFAARNAVVAVVLLQLIEDYQPL